MQMLYMDEKANAILWIANMREVHGYCPSVLTSSPCKDTKRAAAKFSKALDKFESAMLAEASRLG